ncbi:MAG: hypothetical protein RIC56_11120 [Pseudomonadales bacterium]
MSEAELTENALLAWSNFITAFGLGITIISGYLLAAFNAGAILTRSQLMFVNVVFIGAMGTVVAGMYGFRELAADLDGLAFAMTTQRSFAPISWVAHGATAFTVICTIGAIQFMRGIRTAK